MLRCTFWWSPSSFLAQHFSHLLEVQFCSRNEFSDGKLSSFPYFVSFFCSNICLREISDQLVGYLFEQPWSTLYALVGAATGHRICPFRAVWLSLGACCIFSLARSTFGAFLRKKVLDTSISAVFTHLVDTTFKMQNFPAAANIRENLLRNEQLYMLLFRLVPVFPFW